MNAQFKGAAAALVLLVAAGCASMDGLNTQAKVNEPASLKAGQSLADARVSSEAWPQGDWWKRFNDPQLDRLMDEALTGSPTLRVAQARARKALSFVQTTGAALYPRVNGVADVTPDGRVG